MRAVLFQRRRCYLKEGNNMLAPILFFYLRKIHSASLSIMLGHEHNFQHNALILGVTPKTIMLKFSSIIYLTLPRPRIWSSLLKSRFLIQFNSITTRYRTSSSNSILVLIHRQFSNYNYIFFTTFSLFVLLSFPSMNFLSLDLVVYFAPAPMAFLMVRP